MKKVVVIVALLMITIACESKKPPEVALPSKDFLPAGTRIYSPVIDAEGNKSPSFESIASAYGDCRVSEVARSNWRKSAPFYFVDCRKNF
jgi:hypothetical protein